MKLAFCLYRYFPFGGLQRDFLRIARACLQRGHEVHVYTGAWEGELEDGLHIHILTLSGWQNHSRCHSFSRQLARRLKQEEYDLVLGFNKMPGLDVYYAADVCYQSRVKKLKPFWYTWLPRYNQYSHDEKAVFSPKARTQILVLADMQRDEYRACYHTAAERLHLLPPGISRDRMAPPHADVIRAELRKERQVKADEHILLMVGSGFKTKGLDRVLESMAALPSELKSKTRLWVVGQDNPARFIRQAQRLNLSQQIEFLGGRHDVARYYLAADFLVHPAYHENTGTVLLEALVSGLPVLTVDVCGYAHYIREADAGRVVDSPFQQEKLNQALEEMLLSPERAQWQSNGLAFAKTADIYSLPEKAADFIEAVVTNKRQASIASRPHPSLRTQRSNPQEFTPSLMDCRAALAMTESRPASFAMTENSSASFTMVNELNQHFTHFDQFMQLQGQSFRALEGRRTQRVLIDNKSYFIKQHFGVGWKEILKNLFQFKLPITSAKNEWLAIQKLQELGILTPTIKAYGLRGHNPARLQSFLLMDELSPTISLEDFCRDWKTQPPTFKLKQTLIRQVATIAKTLHEHGINHRDFYICHFLLDLNSYTPQQTKLDTLKLFLIDLHRAGLHSKLSLRWQIKDLAGLYFSSKDLGLTQRDYWRFIKNYRQQPMRDIIMNEFNFWRKIAARGDQLYHDHA